ncbi:MAG: class I SAM-dependent methyltransferase [Fibrobacter sp.]|nr:class I SAM-dependent methyltransferase [Fibrobacter sp.]
MFTKLNVFFERPKPYASNDTYSRIWTDEHISKNMLELHLNPRIDAASRNHALITESANWMISKFNLTRGKKVLDLGCGPGLYSSIIAETGANVTGVDISKRSLDYARKKVNEKSLKVNYINESYLEWKTEEKFDFVYLIYLDFHALKTDQRKSLLANIKTYLKDGGLFLFDIPTIHNFKKIEEMTNCVFHKKGGFFSPNPHFEFEILYKYEEEGLTFRRHIVIEEKHTYNIEMWHKYFTDKEIENELKKAGFAIAEKYSTVKGDVFRENSEEITLAAKLF